jgi:hypothetical protein
LLVARADRAGRDLTVSARARVVDRDSAHLMSRARSFAIALLWIALDLRDVAAPRPRPCPPDRRTPRGLWIAGGRCCCSSSCSAGLVSSRYAGLDCNQVAGLTATAGLVPDASRAAPASICCIAPTRILVRAAVVGGASSRAGAIRVLARAAAHRGRARASRAGRGSASRTCSRACTRRG